MQICPKCQTENNDDVKFCRECGNKLIKEVENEPTAQELEELAERLNSRATKKQLNLEKFIGDVPKTIFNFLKNTIFFKNVKNTLITSVGMAVIVLLIVGVLNSGYLFFTTAFNSNNFEQAQKVYDMNKGNTGIKSNIDGFLVDKSTGILKEYEEEKITAEDANEKLKTILPYISTSDAEQKISTLENSRLAFSKGEEFLTSGDKFSAIVEFTKVISEDKNFQVAQEKIDQNKPEVKTQALSKLIQCANANDFEGGLSLIATVEKIFPNDSDLNTYKSDLEQRKKNFEIQKMKDEQKVKVISCRSYNDGYYSIFRKVNVILQNDTNMVIKTFSLGVLQFDSNGYPVDNRYSIYGEGNLKRCGGGSPNIQPGDTWGYGYSWDIEDEATKIKACVISAELYDGGTWNNPYYDIWLAAEKDRY